MSAYGVALFIHVLSAISFFTALALLQRGGVLLRRAETVEQVRSWLGVVESTKRMFPMAALFLFATGLFMTAQVWTFTTPWVLVGIVTLVALMGLGSGIVGRGVGRIGAAAAASEEGPVPDQLKRLVAEPNQWMVLSANSAAAVGLVWLMTNKPGWVASIAIVVGLWVIGAVGGRMAANRPA